MTDVQNPGAQAPRMWTEAEILDLVDRAIAHPSERHEREQRRIAEQQQAQHEAGLEAAALSRRVERIAAMKRLPDETIWRFERRKAAAEEILSRCALAPNGTSDTGGGGDDGTTG